MNYKKGEISVFMQLLIIILAIVVALFAYRVFWEDTSGSFRTGYLCKHVIKEFKGCDGVQGCRCLHQSWGGLGGCDSCECEECLFPD
ncbi:MAG: hypothetical protein Q8L34_00355 [Candidatus Woesearchaeota archaeon]|nr:hypothetical protein [Candidatus Woesearchaeota archaeon]